MSIPLRSAAQASSPPRLVEIIPGSERIEELSDEELGSDYEDMGTATAEEQANIAYLESVRVPIKDSLVTDTSETDAETAKVILPYLEGNPNDFSLNTFGIPNLQRPKHDPFLRKQLGDWPAQAAGLDAARPWIMYWSLQGLTAMGADITSYNKT
jgi:protein farnesyltransferase subunit beta